MTMDAERKKIAYRHGQDAYWRGDSRNPYTDTILRKEWFDGYDDAYNSDPGHEEEY